MEEIRLTYNFVQSEFDQPGIPGSGKNMDKKTINKLQQARSISGVPYVINSGWRSKEYNKEIGGATGSLHVEGKAVDIKCSNESDRYNILFGLILAGFQRVLIYRGHIHAVYSENIPLRLIGVGDY